jgi:hypothetical protein
MQGRFVPRKAGWDTHGLPVEIEVEKQLGISGKQDIERVGVAEFNRLCRESVWKYRGEWEQLSERMGYWLDYTQPVRHVPPRLRRERLVGAQDAVRQGAALPRAQDPAVLLALRHVALVARAGARLQGRRGPERLRRARPGARRRAPAPHPRLDHHALDARQQHRAGGEPGAAVRRAAQEVGRRVDDRARRGARGRRARRRLGGPLGRRGDDAGHRARRDALPPAARLDPVPGRGRARADRRRVVRVGRRRVGHRAHGAGVRRRRLRGRAAPRAGVRAAGERARRVRRGDPDGRRTVREAGRRRDHRGAQVARRAVEGAELRALVPALLALRNAAAVRGARLVVHPHDGVPAAHAGAQRGRELEPARGRQRALRRVAREQHRLGRLARPLLGHAAAGLGQRCGPAGDRGRRLVRGAGRQGRPRAAGGLRPAQAARRRVHVAGAERHGHDAPRAGGDRRLVRLGVDAVRAVALPVREPREGRGAVPGRLHRRGRGPDARVVLLAAGDRDRAGRRAAQQRRRGYGAGGAVPGRGGERAGARRAGTEDVQEPRQRREPVGRDGASRGRCRASLPGLVQPDLGVPPLRRGGDPADGGELPGHAQERVPVLRPLRELRLVARATPIRRPPSGRCSTGGCCRGWRPSSARPTRC